MQRVKMCKTKIKTKMAMHCVTACDKSVGLKAKGVAFLRTINSIRFVVF
jgi:hypothetical protein